MQPWPSLWKDWPLGHVWRGEKICCEELSLISGLATIVADKSCSVLNQARFLKDFEILDKNLFGGVPSKFGGVAKSHGHNVKVSISKSNYIFGWPQDSRKSHFEGCGLKHSFSEKLKS